eukprot:PhM_4_TR7188/c0_g1_i1/m.29959
MARVLNIPYSEMGEFLTKSPMNIAALTLPARGDHTTQPTGTIDDAKIGRAVVLTAGPQIRRAEVQPPKVHDASFAKWEVFQMNKGSNFDDALAKLAAINQASPRVLKMKIKFLDGTEVCFARSNPEVHTTLAYTHTYNPNSVFFQKTEGKKQDMHTTLKKSLQFTVDGHGRKMAHPQQPGMRGSLNFGGNLPYPTNAERAELFARCDPNGNGVLSLAELDLAVMTLWPHYNNKPAIMRAYKAADKNGSGWLGKKEFKFFLRFLVHYNDVWRKFDALDTSRDRRVTYEEFAAGQKKVGLALDENALRAAFSDMDKNGGGYVLFDEFCSWMAKTKAELDLRNDHSAV